jgi:hypothetical protein
MTTANGSAAPAALGSNAYSFYLNIVVLEHMASPSTPAASSLDHVNEAHEEEEVSINLAPAAITADSLPQKHKTPSSEQKRGLLSLSVSDLDKSLHNIGRAVSQTSSTFRNKGAAFVASKTMVNRALTALAKSLPDLAYESEDLELTIDKRFHQGRVIVLQVDLKATAMPRYVEEILGEDAADNYRSAMHTLTLLKAAETMTCLENEMLPKVRQGLMNKLKDTLLKTLKAKDELLEVDCIALEEAEEARWLFTYMEFQEQMK